MSEELFKQMAQSILDGEEEVSADLANQALAAGIDPLQAITCPSQESGRRPPSCLPGPSPR